MTRRGTRGFTILMASLVAGIVLMVTIGALSLATREFQISGITKRSSIAFYNADTGIECAFYHDTVNTAFPEPTASGLPVEPSDTYADEIWCVGDKRGVSLDACADNSGVRSCTYSFAIGPDPAIGVVITKNLSAAEDRWTVIEARGMSGSVLGQRIQRIREYTYGNPP